MLLLAMLLWGFDKGPSRNNPNAPTSIPTTCLPTEKIMDWGSAPDLPGFGAGDNSAAPSQPAQGPSN